MYSKENSQITVNKLKKKYKKLKKYTSDKSIEHKVEEIRIDFENIEIDINLEKQIEKVCNTVTNLQIINKCMYCKYNLEYCKNDHNKKDLPMSYYDKIHWIISDNLINNSIDYKSMEKEYGILETKQYFCTMLKDDFACFYMKLKNLYESITKYLEF